MSARAKWKGSQSISDTDSTALAVGFTRLQMAALFIVATVLATAVFAQTGSNSPSSSNPSSGGVDNSLSPIAVYNGSQTFASPNVRLRIANGGAGQSGLIGALGNAFVDYMVVQGTAPFQVGWYLGDTTQSLSYMALRQVDIAITYNPAAESSSLNSGVSVESLYGFRDHFVFVGPPSNPANIAPSDTILEAFQKIVASGAATTAANPTRFLSRFDKSATNIKESEIFIAIGQVPWAYAYSTWYHQYPRFPLQAVAAAATLGEYTLTDRGTLLSSPSSVTNAIVKYICASDDESDRLLNPAHVLLNAITLDDSIAKSFMTWMNSTTGGQQVVANFKANGTLLYSQAPGFNGASAGGCDF
uniref:PBP domain-containing protein n=1 Tax=Mycena chlorophos TaxID=658473 RepID=A0ABQ0LK03_MYCCL|nr:predicted protein [Mycena chlorophos]